MKHIIVCLLFACAFSYAQNSPIKITIYSSDSAAKSVEQTSTTKFSAGSNEYQNVLKWNYCLLGRGVFMINYERQIKNNFTFEFGVGMTFADFVFTTYYEMGNLSLRGYPPTTSTSGGNTIEKRLLINPFEESVKTTGFAFEVSPKYYFDKDEFEGFYLSPYLSYRKYNYALTVMGRDQLGQTTTNQFNSLYYNFLDIGAKGGYQYTFGTSDRMYYDFYVGFAYRNANVMTLLVTTESGFFGGSETYTTFEQSFGLPQAMLGAKIGFAF